MASHARTSKTLTTRIVAALIAAVLLSLGLSTFFSLGHAHAATTIRTAAVQHQQVHSATLTASLTSTVPITPGMTYWQASVQTGVSLNAIESANPWPATQLPVGQSITIPGGGSSSAPVQQPVTQSQFPDHPTAQFPAGDGDNDGYDIPASQVSATGGSSGGSVSHSQPSSQAPVQSSAPVQQQSSTSQSSSSAPTGSGGGQFSIPGAPQSFSNCVAFRESTNGTNPAAHGNIFGIIPASGFNVSGMSVAQQEQVAGQLFAQSGKAAWSPFDGCP